jgi:hypothetical protein
MKNLLLIVLIGIMILFAGCTDEAQSPVATPARTPVVTTIQTHAVTTARSTVVTPTTEIVSETGTVLVTPTTLLTTPTGVSDQASWQTYTNQEFHFAIQIPKSWTATGESVTTAGVKKYKVIFEDPSFTSSQYITITPNSAGLSLEDWANIFLTQVKSDSSKSLIGQEPLQLDGTPAKKVVLTLGSGKDTLESTIIMVIKGDNSYFMEFTSRKTDYPVYSESADRMIRTFTFS